MVQHDDGNHQIAQQGQRAIRHVLDQILSAPIQAVPSMYDSTIGLEIGESGPVPMNSDLLEGIDVDDRGPFLEWLEGTTDFNEPWLAWMNLS
ncbi:hypothetical protein N7466_010687 [Penicillium verhagenii]|uniref:uncharacterized protein n=1 Tax=Penicillium verhagenii TaxID=1562060 RepID=UPI002545B5CA|nr:uncharacterized protein N7466_010687 [Penicillium verhagenii]KAJ5917133.1 hypothetical protein N7466_010687 [Penicillium verhagenii]